MLIKDRDAKQEAVEQLRDLLALNLSPRKKFLIERELKNLSPGEDGGKNASHFINFYCADSRNWAIPQIDTGGRQTPGILRRP